LQVCPIGGLYWARAGAENRRVLECQQEFTSCSAVCPYSHSSA